ncbi:hypothetical protein ACWGB8_16075 [Kitasatospora sp. NPDC054939]
MTDGFDHVVQVAVLTSVEEEDRIVPVDRILTQPGVEPAEVRGAGCEVGNQSPEQLGPHDQLLQHGEVGDGRLAVRVGLRVRPQSRPGRPRGPCEAREVGAQRGGQGGVERRVGVALGELDRIDRAVDPGLVHEHGGPVRLGRLSGVDERDQPAVRVDAVGEHVAAGRPRP